MSSDQRLNKFIQECKNPVFFIGAGVSASAGIKTFRTADGHWVDGHIINPLQFATYKNYSTNRTNVWNWYKERRMMVLNAKENESHRVLNYIIENQKGFVINQNVDGFVHNSLEVHGNIHYTKCEECYEYIHLDKVKTIDECPKCGAEESLRPDILFFDESYHPNLFNDIYKQLEDTNTIFIVGTSNSCYISELINQAVQLHTHQIRVIEINIDMDIKGKMNYFMMNSDDFFTLYHKIKHL